jgi:hypothetical protein
MGVKISARSMIGSTGLPKVAGFLFWRRQALRLMLVSAWTDALVGAASAVP